MIFEDYKNMLEIKNLTCGYGEKPIIKEFNLCVQEGDIIAIIGPNGCGKSTLLKAIYQLCKIEKGEIIYKGQKLLNTTPEKVKNLGIAYFMQRNSIFTSLTVKENIFLSMNGMNSLDKMQKLDQIVTSYPTLKEQLNKYSGLLSGGQQQQLAMAMLLVQDADLWLLDEPTAGLDQGKTESFIETILKYKNIKTIILVEHKTMVVDKLANRIINVKN